MKNILNDNQAQVKQSMKDMINLYKSGLIPLDLLHLLAKFALAQEIENRFQVKLKKTERKLMKLFD